MVVQRRHSEKSLAFASAFLSYLEPPHLKYHGNDLGDEHEGTDEKRKRRAAAKRGGGGAERRAQGEGP